MFISKPLAIKEPIESMQNQHQHVLRFQAIKVHLFCVISSDTMLLNSFSFLHCRGGLNICSSHVLISVH